MDIITIRPCTYCNCLFYPKSKTDEFCSKICEDAFEVWAEEEMMAREIAQSEEGSNV